jgi:hypothetical protein
VAHPQIAAFARLANGGAKPVRSIAGQNTLFTRTIHDMAYDPVRDEIVVPSFYAFAILTFRGDATGDATPVRKIFGPSTLIVNADSVALDAVHGEIFVPQSKGFNNRWDRVLVFPRDADGDIAPIRILEGPDTGLRPSRITVDPVRNLLIVSGGGGIRIFDRLATGNTKPLRYINGPGAGDVALLTNNSANGLIFGVVRPGGGDEAEGRFSPQDYVGVWSVFDNGDVPARLTIGGPNLLLKDARGIALDPKNKDVIVSDKTLNAVLTFHVPEVF